MTMAEAVEQTPTKLNVSDFVLGVTHGAALANGGHISIDMDADKTHEAYASVFEALMDSAEEENLKLMFRIRPHEIHRDSLTLAGAFLGLLKLDGIRCWSDPFLEYDAKEETREAMFPELTGGEELYQKLGSTLLEELAK